MPPPPLSPPPRFPPGPPRRHRPADAVEYTISEDHSGGHAAHAESGFGRLAGQRANLPPSLADSPEALADYEMQLRLLEQQNKKRLMMARQEQDLERHLQPPAFLLPPNGPNGPSPKRVKTEVGDEPDENDNAMVDALPFAPAPVPRHVVLHRVRCSWHRCDGRIYQDEPTRRDLDGELHLVGSQVIHNLADFCANRGEPTAFVVFREANCDHGADWRGAPAPRNPLGHHAARELISVVSSELYAVMRRISLFPPDRFDREHHEMYPPRETGPLLSGSTSEYTRYFLFHHREALRQAANQDLPGGDVKCLLSYLQQHPDPISSKCEDLFSRGLVTPDTVPWLFRPNEIVVARRGNLDVAYMVRRVPGSRTPNSIDLDCWHWGYDGNALRRKDRDIVLTTPATHDRFPITNLSVYPLHYATGDATMQRLLARGRQFWYLRHQIHVSYEGPDYAGERVYPWDSRCMIDYQTYHSFHSYADAFKFTQHKRAIFDDGPDEISAATEELSAADTILLPPGIHGFFLKEKKWVHLLVDNIAPVNWNKQAFDQLVLPPRIKNMVKALVLGRKTDLINAGAYNTNTTQTRPRRSDLIRGKGEGLIMLLHGGPGTGKTLTAESVAELAGMPLYNVTCGDVGTKPEAVEKYLTSVLHLGQKWKCVLLLDEADVFLEQRSLSDLKRNSLVSVFLRTLEYYDGILLLTSNRVGTFDAAFKSRIQVALHYPPLDAASRRQIWRNFLELDTPHADTDAEIAPTTTSSHNDNNPNPSATDAADVHTPNPNSDSNSENITTTTNLTEISTHLDALSSQHEMNGRQIRNAVATARQLARFEGVPLAWTHLEQAIAAASDFDRCVESLDRGGAASGSAASGSQVGGAGVGMSTMSMSDEEWDKFANGEYNRGGG